MKSLAKVILSFPMWVMAGYLKLLSYVWPSGATTFRDLIYREAQNPYQIWERKTLAK